VPRPLLACCLVLLANSIPNVRQESQAAALGNGGRVAGADNPSECQDRTLILSAEATLQAVQRVLHAQVQAVHRETLP